MLLVQQGKQSFSNQEELNSTLKESLENLINQRVLFEKAKQDTDIVVTNDDGSKTAKTTLRKYLLGLVPSTF